MLHPASLPPAHFPIRHPVFESQGVMGPHPRPVLHRWGILHSSAKQYTALYWTALHSTVLHCTKLHYTLLHYTAVDCITMHYHALLCTTLHYDGTKQQCSSLYCTTVFLLLHNLGDITVFGWVTGRRRTEAAETGKV